MPLEQFQVNTKFLNTLPDEWSKFVTDVKLVKDLHTTNVDQLHAHCNNMNRHAIDVLWTSSNPPSNNLPLGLESDCATCSGETNYWSYCQADCTKPKRKRDEMVNDKVLLVQAPSHVPKIASWPISSRNGSDALTEVSEVEKQQETVQNSNSYAQLDGPCFVYV
ncbi:hypothetical protein Tco_0772469 [Tanacetum coccineum]|uniref:Uncharacterized protein n=1 Tax=Tanacetum coccineum TaxID=301880 RepID=A0ABQ4ZHZ6_9ASTR